MFYRVVEVTYENAETDYRVDTRAATNAAWAAGKRYKNQNAAETWITDDIFRRKGNISVSETTVHTEEG